MWWIWTIVLNGLVGAGAYWAARHAFRQPAGCARLLAAATLAWAWVTVGIEFLGATGWLTRWPLLIWSAVGCLLGVCCRFAGAREPRIAPDASQELDPGSFRESEAPAEPRVQSQQRPRTRGLVPTAMAKFGAGSIVAKGTASEVWEPSATLALALMIWAALWLGLQSLLLPVKVVSDGPIYHLYFAARWWKEGRLSLIPTPFGETAAPYFPAVGDLWFTWLITAWGGDRLARVGQSPFLLLAGLAVFAIAKRLGVGAAGALIAVAWFLTSTPFFLFSFEPNVDTIFVAGYLIACFFFLRYALGDDGLPALVLGGLAAGGALGTKAPAILFVPVLLVLVSIAVVRRRLTAAQQFGHLATVLLSPLVLAGFWYARNAWLSGNPLYPLHLASLGRTWLAGWYGTEVMLRSQYYLPIKDLRSGIDILLAVFDPREAPVWVAAVLGLWMVGRSWGKAARWFWLAAGLALVNIATYWVMIPYRTQQRFMLQALGLAAIPLAGLLERSKALRVLAVGLLGLHLLTPQTWPFATREREIPWDLSTRIPNAVGGLITLPVSWSPGTASWAPHATQASAALSLGLALGSLAAAWAWRRMAERPSWGRATAAMMVTASVGVAAGAVIYPWDVSPRWLFYPSFPEYNRGWAELELLSGPEGARVAYAGTNLPYYLMAYGLR
ncbi:MAG TPA: glycosyltransferase family 39 protein, partial [Isosphaeraceae bacterium]|nr:glycosyltransferase family 39 protein [Isosphaeraceae bacterium]